MLYWKDEIKTREESLRILKELKALGISVYFSKTYKRLLFRPRDIKIKIIHAKNVPSDMIGKTVEGMGPAMAKALGENLSKILQVNNKEEFDKIWKSMSIG